MPEAAAAGCRSAVAELASCSLQVYVTLALALCLSAAGVYACALTGFGQGEIGARGRLGAGELLTANSSTAFTLPSCCPLHDPLAGLGVLGFLISVPWMLSTPPRPDNLNKRRALFGAAAVSQGLLLAPIVRASLALHPGVLFTAFAGTAGTWQPDVDVSVGMG